jgi:excisionase family DNA binding protein
MSLGLQRFDNARKSFVSGDVDTGEKVKLLHDLIEYRNYIEANRLSLIKEIQAMPSKQKNAIPKGITTKEAAILLKVHVETVRRRLRKGHILGDKIRGKWIIDIDYELNGKMGEVA